MLLIECDKLVVFYISEKLQLINGVFKNIFFAVSVMLCNDGPMPLRVCRYEYTLSNLGGIAISRAAHDCVQSLVIRVSQDLKAPSQRLQKENTS